MGLCSKRIDSIRRWSMAVFQIEIIESLNQNRRLGEDLSHIE